MIKKEFEESLLEINFFMVNDVVSTSDLEEGDTEDITNGGEF